MAIYPVILCGGSGTRLWPASQARRPKQFIDLVSELSLFQETVRRVAPLSEGGRVVVVAGVAHRELVEEQLASLGVEGHLILEPTGRDSAPAMAAAALWIQRLDPEGTAVFVASDHYIPEASVFRKTVRDAVAVAANERIVTMGIVPTSPSPAYGYIQPEHPGPSKVRRFVEKPDRAEAVQYVAAGYLWNSGNFIAPVRVLIAELSRFAPDLVSAVGAAMSAPVGGSIHPLGSSFASAPKISIDYAVMEKSEAVWVLPVDFEWSDLGAWDAVAATGQGGRGVWIDHGSNGCLVRAAPGMVVATAGVSNLAIIVEPDAVLVCDLKQAQDVKVLVEKLSRREGLSQPAGTRPNLTALSEKFGQWLKLNALPLWATLGVEADGAFAEAINSSGEQVGNFRRARVQARQAYVYSLASTWGWGGGYAALVSRGLARFEATNLRKDGLFRTLVTTTGDVIDDDASLYDQAFVLLAMATAMDAGQDVERCRMTARSIQSSLDQFRLSQGGWREPVGAPFQSNAHMHLLEAALSLEEVDPDGPWQDMANAIVGLARAYFIDVEGEFLREFFDECWRPAEGEAGRLVEPGHQFEWAWLLTRWGRSRVEPWALAAGQSLFAVGERGIDTARGVAIDQLNDVLEPRSARARLWPQTEWLKAALILAEEAEGDDRRRFLVSAAQAYQALERYLMPSGLWNDKMTIDGAFDEEPSPASSLYHIVTAYRQLRETCTRLE